MKNLATSRLKTAGISAPDKTNFLNKFLIDGGPLTWVIVAFGLLSALGLIVFNAINLSKAKFAPEDLKGALFDHMANYLIIWLIAVCVLLLNLPHHTHHT